MRRASRLHLPVSLLQSVVEVLMDCGGGRNECIVYTTAPNQSPHRIDGFIHPVHSSTPVSTTVEVAELHRVWDELRDADRSIVMQVHTHPGSAFHSSIDDDFPIVHSVGFPSLVLPNFGRRGVEGAHLAIYEGEGKWSSPPNADWDKYVVIEHAA